MKTEAPQPARSSVTERRWALLRWALGMAQMFGAVVSVVLLVQTGANAVSIGAVIVTSLFTVISLWLFRAR